MTDLPAAIERLNGQIVAGWPVHEGSAAVQIVQFGTRAGVTTFSTLGLSRHPLVVNESTEVRQEAMIKTEATTLWPRDALAWISDRCLEAHQALTLGSLVTLGPIDGSAMEVLLASRLERLSTATDSIEVVALAPITKDEAEYVRSVGLTAWEHQLEHSGVTLGRLDRAPVR